MDTNLLQLAQQLQVSTNSLDLALKIQAISEGLDALKSFGIGGVTVAGVLAWIFRRRFLNSAVVNHLENTALAAVDQGKGLGQALADQRIAKEAEVAVK